MGGCCSSSTKGVQNPKLITATKKKLKRSKSQEAYSEETVELFHRAATSAPFPCKFVGLL